MSSHNVRFGGQGIPQTILPDEDPALLEALALAESADDDADVLAMVGAVVSENPRSLAAWAALGDAARDTIEAYAYYRIGYHRGLDALRQNGWRGSGYVRWEHPSNRPFLRCLEGLRHRAEQIGETDEVERCALFLRQLEPGWPGVVDA